MIPFLHPYAKQVVGLEITNQAIKLLRLKHNKTNYVLADHAIVELPKEVIVDGKIKRFDQVHKILSQALKQTKSLNLPTVLALPSQQVICKTIELPTHFTEPMCLVKIKENFSHYFPGIKEELCFDYVVLSEAENNKKILLAATRKEQLTAYRTLLKLAKARLMVVEVDTYALWRSLSLATASEQLATVCFVDVNPITTKLFVIHQRQIIFTQHWPTEISANWHLHARHSFQLYAATHPAVVLNKIFLSGIHSKLYQQILQEENNIAVSLVNVFSNKVLHPIGDENCYDHLQVCLGLALRRISRW